MRQQLVGAQLPVDESRGRRKGGGEGYSEALSAKPCEEGMRIGLAKALLTVDGYEGGKDRGGTCSH